MDRATLLRYTGNTDQLYSVRRFTYEDGDARGMNAIRVKSPSGLRFTILEDRGLDLYDCEYNGVNLSFLDKTGLRSGTRFHGEQGEFAYGFNGGLLFTAGMLNIGTDGMDGDIYQPAHGRYDGHGAREVCLRTAEDGTVTVSGLIGEAALFCEHLQIRRTITVPADRAAICIEDVMENCSPIPAEIAMLYHVNLGYPMLQEGVRILTGDDTVLPRTDEAAAHFAEYDVMGAPSDGCPEQVFFHDITPDAEGWAEVAAENAALGLRFTVRFDKSTLPVLSQWKSQASGDYALGLEPCTNHLAGRAGSREAGELVTLEGFGKRTFRVELAVSPCRKASR